MHRLTRVGNPVALHVLDRLEAIPERRRVGLFGAEARAAEGNDDATPRLRKFNGRNGGDRRRALRADQNEHGTLLVAPLRCVTQLGECARRLRNGTTGDLVHGAALRAEATCLRLNAAQAAWRGWGEIGVQRPARA